MFLGFGTAYNHKISIFIPLMGLILTLLFRSPEAVLTLFIVGQSAIHFLFSFVGGISREALPYKYLAIVAMAGGVAICKAIYDRRMLGQKHTFVGKDNHIIVLVSLLIGCLLFISLAYTPSANYGFRKAIGYFIYNLSIFFFIFFLVRNLKQIKRLIYFVLIFGVIQLAALIIHSVVYEGTIFVYHGLQLTPTTVGGYTLEQSQDLARRFVLLIFTCIFLYKISSTRVFKILLLALILLFLIYIPLSGARGPIIAFLVALWSIPLIYGSKFSKTVLILSLFAILGITIVAQLAPEEVTIRYTQPISISVYERLELYKKAVDVFPTHILWGWGAGGYSYAAYGVDERIYPHNIIIEFLVELGLLGFFIFGVFVYFVVKRSITALRFTGYKSYSSYYVIYSSTIFLSALIFALFSGDITRNDQIWITAALVCKTSHLVENEAGIKDATRKEWTAHKFV